MLKLAVKARLPLIRVTTDDPIYVMDLLREATGENILLGDLQKPSKVEPHSVAFVTNPKPSLSWNLVYQVYAKKKATLIVVGGDSNPVFFEAGFLTATPGMIESFVKGYANPKEVKKIVNALNGLSFKQAVEISKLAMTKKGEYSARAVYDVRRQFFGHVRGLESVGHCTKHYQPPITLMNWLIEEGQFVKKPVHDLLTPRGLLFGGYPGTGKTEGAKFIADELDLPLYRLNIGILMSKWAGESEKNLSAALDQAENCSPCVLLLDEVEKLFMQDDDSGVITRLLATLLWWLQEHRKPVFTIMTTNKDKAIPPELIRPGRIDKVLTFDRLTAGEAKEFYWNVAEALHDEYGLPYPTACEFLHGKWSQAEVVSQVLRGIKQVLTLDQAGNLKHDSKAQKLA